MHSQRGLDPHQEQKSSQLVRDVRPLGQRIHEDIFKKPLHVALLNALLAAFAFMVPALADFFLLLAILFFLIPFCSTNVLPFRLPLRAKCKDYNNLIPGTRKPKMAQGIYFFGNKKTSQEEIWFTNEDMRTHVLIFGSTGSGKTEFLVSLAYNALIQSSGFIYVDGKGDNSLFAKIFSMVKYMGREDDLLLVNFMTGARDINGPQEKRISNTLNPFSMGSSSMLSNLVVSMMESSGSSSDSDMWKGRAISFVEALMKILVAMRDAGNILLTANVVRNYFGLDRIEAMVLDKAFIRDGEYAINIENLPDNIMEPMRNYLFNLPGYHKDRRGKQVSQVFEQHGFITMQLTRVFSSLADTYGHILRTKLAEVDLKDVVINRRILVVLLPALEKSPDELSNLGKVIISTLKVMMASGLGDEVEGRYQDLVQRKPTNSSTPFLCILDEYGYYAVKGFAVVPAQARSLGFSVVFAGQDLPAFQKASKEEAASIGANTNIKICMKLEDPTETWEFFQKTAGESYVTQVESFQANTGSVTNTYLDAKSAKVEKRQRVDLLDLKEQREGDGHLFFQSKLIRFRAFYADPKPVKEMRLNQCLKVDIPKDADLYTLVKGIEDYEATCKAGKPTIKLDESALIRDFLEVLNKNEKGKIEAAVGALISLSEHQEQSDEIEQGAFEPVEQDGVNVFLPLAQDGAAILLLNRKSLVKKLNYINQLIESDESKAKQLTDQLVHDLHHLTTYQAPDLATFNVEKLASMIYELADHVVARKQDKET
jgi:intracellular multiplication protein IcmO